MKMWTCPKCKQKFLHTNQTHSCNDKTIADFLKGKSAHTIELYNYFIEEFLSIANFRLHPTKSAIGFAAKTRFGAITRLGKNFVDVSLTFNQPFEDNLCFYRIGQVPGTSSFHHYIRIFQKEDINDEVRKYLRMAFELGNREK